MPSDLVGPVGAPHFASHADTWLSLVRNAKKSIYISALWVALTSGNASVGGDYGRELASALEESGIASVVTNDCRVKGWPFSCVETEKWSKNGRVNVEYLNMDHVLQTSHTTRDWGCIHSKYMVIDGETACVGSANLAWTSLAQTREVSLLVQKCPALARVVDAQVQRYAFGARAQSTVPQSWPMSLHSNQSAFEPLSVLINGTQEMEMFLTASPLPFVADETPDLEGLVDLIGNATSSISIELMDYSASSIYENSFHHDNDTFWGTLDNALRAAAVRGVAVRLMVSKWFRTSPIEVQFWRSLDAIQNVEVKMFVTPSYAGGDEGSRVNHAKFMIVDDVAVVSTSNWAREYFTAFGGGSWIVRQKGTPVLRNQLLAMFERDWACPFVHSVQS